MNLTQECRSIAIAGHTGDTATVQAGLASPYPEARVLAVGAAVRLNLLVAADIAGFLADPSIDVRYRALEVLPSVEGAEGAATAVIGLLDNPELAEMAAFTLGELTLVGSDRAAAIAALEAQAMDHDDPLCRESAVAALGSIAAGLPSILRACGDVATVRRRAILALAPFDGPEVDEALNKALTDRDWQVRQAAEDLIGPDPDAAG